MSLRGSLSGMDWLSITLIAAVILGLVAVIAWSSVRSRRMPHDEPNEDTRRDVDEAQRRRDATHDDIGGIGGAGMP